MKAVQLLIESKLPPELRRKDRKYTAKEISSVLSDIAVHHPEAYNEISKVIADTGRNASYWQGETISLSDLKPLFDKRPVLEQMEAEIASLDRSAPDYKEQRELIWHKYNDILMDTTAKLGRESQNSIAAAVLSGARGKNPQLKMMLTTPGLYADSFGETIPMFIRNSFGEGVRPAEFLASTYGARSTVISTKIATAKGGDLGKQLFGASVDQVVSESDCHTANGIDLSPEDKSLRGRVLAREVAGIPAGTVIGRSEMKKIRKEAPEHVLVRSPLTCQSKDGVCQHCVGKFHNQKFPEIGYAIGAASAQAVSEPVTQGALSCLAYYTKVRMADGSVKQINQIKVGDLVLGADMNGKAFPVVVKAVWDQGLQTVQRRHFKYGQTSALLSLDSTADHVILMQKRVWAADYRKANNGSAAHPDNDKLIKEKVGVSGTNVSAVLPSDREYTTGIKNDWALMLGCMLGDGIKTPESSTVRFSCADPVLVEDLRRYLSARSFNIVKAKRSHDYHITSDTASGWGTRDAETGKMLKGIGSKHPLKKALKEAGLIGKYAHEKEMPSAVWGWDDDSILDLVAGYLATDGSVYLLDKKRLSYEFGSCSKKLLEQIKEIMSVRFCVYFSLVKKAGHAGQGNRVHDFYSLKLNRKDQVTRFTALIKDRVPGIKRQTIEKLISSLDLYKGNCSDKGFLCKRQKQVDELGLIHCFDISVDHPDELFVLSNGLIVKNSKHTGGIAGAKRKFSGFAAVNQFVQSPEDYPDRGVVSEVEGVVQSVEEAPQGGHIVKIGDQEHYVPSGYAVMVKPGEAVEAGDQISDGLVDAADIVRLRGLGEGRRYYTDRLAEILEDSGLSSDRRNLEVVARGTINHVRAIDDIGIPGVLPEDTLKYNRLVSDYAPPANTRQVEVSSAIGQYLQQPAMHFSIGTRLTKKQADRLKKAGFNQVHVSPDKPNFESEMIRLRTANQGTDDWLQRMHGSYLKANIQDAAVRGQDTNIKENPHFAPRLAYGKDFGKNTERTGRF